MKRELGDICWYLAQACMALDTTFDEVIEMNVDKLKARYPGGSLMFINLKIVRRETCELQHSTLICLNIHERLLRSESLFQHTEQDSYDFSARTSTIRDFIRQSG